jgi:hypothetical protein
VVDLAGLGLELGKMFQAAGDAEVPRVVDDGFDAKGSPFLQVLLHPGVLVAEVHADLRPGAEDPLAVDVLGRTTQRSREHHGDLAGSTDADVVLDERLEERPGATGVVEDAGGGGLDLAHGELPPKARNRLAIFSNKAGDGTGLPRWSRRK